MTPKERQYFLTLVRHYGKQIDRTKMNEEAEGLIRDLLSDIKEALGNG